ncbi:hypothetical protein OF83DRAFT_451839 [Amylostereum chailletii]|nr:hypothetical protein OF83DRAFT_451839 [Amylostereum chailletii]
MRIAHRLLTTTSSWHTQARPLQPTIFHFPLRPMDSAPKNGPRKDAPQKRRRVKRDKSPKYHPLLVEDTRFLAQAFSAGPSKAVERRLILDRIRGIVAACEVGRFGVEDMSMYRYAADLEFAPVEFALVDKQYPTGFPSGASSGDVSYFYDPTAVASLLSHLGLNGVFLSMEQSRYTGDPDIQQAHIPPSIPDESQVWPTYTATSEPGVVYPPILEARSPVAFTLTLPSATTAHTIRLLTAYKDYHPDFSRLNTLLYSWLRSWGIPEISPVTLAILVVKFLQETRSVSLNSKALDDSFFQHVDKIVTIPYKTKNSTENVPLQISYRIPKGTLPEVQEPLIVDFFTVQLVCGPELPCHP